MLDRSRLPGGGGQEAAVAEGVILLVLIAAFFALLATRVRRRMGLGVTGKHWIIVMTVVIVILLALWDASRR
jgi:hypothetical protein